jgi:hypothetical protein
LHRSQPVETASSPAPPVTAARVCAFVCCRAIPVRFGQHCRSGRAAVGTRYAASTPRGTAAADLAAQSSTASTPARASAARGRCAARRLQCGRTARRPCAPHRALTGTLSARRGTLSTHSAEGLPVGHAHHRRNAHDSDRDGTCRVPSRLLRCAARRVVGCACVVATVLQAGWCSDPPVADRHWPAWPVVREVASTVMHCRPPWS